MAKPSTINPEKFFNFQEMKQYYSIPSLSDTEFNPQSPEMAERTGKDMGINVGNTVAKVTENLFLKDSEFINRNSNISKKISLNPISVVLVDATKDHTIITILHLDGSTYMCFKFGGTGRSNGSTIPRTLNSMKSSPVRKLADAEAGSSNLLHQMVMMTINPAADDGGAGKDGGNGDEEGGDDGGNGSGDGGNDDGNGGDGDTASAPAANPWWKLWIEPIKVHGIAMYLDDGHTFRSPTIVTNTYAYECDSWQDIAETMFDFWVETNRMCLKTVPEKAEIPYGNPNLCCPGCITMFGRTEGDVFYDFKWQQHEWDSVQLLIKDVIVMRIAPVSLLLGSN